MLSLYVIQCQLLNGNLNVILRGILNGKLSNQGDRGESNKHSYPSFVDAYLYPNTSIILPLTCTDRVSNSALREV